VAVDALDHTSFGSLPLSLGSWEGAFRWVSASVARRTYHWFMPQAPNDLPHGAGEIDYKRCWNFIAERPAQAYSMVDESTTEEGLVQRGRFMADATRRILSMTASDVVLEIGCGVARIGKELLPHVGRWIGVDVSENMLKIARNRLAAAPNYDLIAVDGADLAPIASGSVDKIYCHAVFIHMDKEDFYNYLLECRRVLRAGGLFCFDVWNLCHEAGWLRWELERAMYKDRRHRPIHRNQFSTPDEVRMMLRKARLEVFHFAETYSIQAVVSHAGASEPTPEWRRSISEKYGRSYEDMYWRPDNIDDFVRAVKQGLASRGVSSSP
jgi:SAM-dependent methyltransferase